MRPLAAALGLSLALGCGPGDAPAPAPPAPAPTWTVLIYANADHNLSPSLATDIDEMSRAALSPGVQVIVAADWNGSARTGDGGQKFPTGTEWLRIVGGGRPAERIRLDPERDFDDPAVLEQIVTEGFSSHPSQRRALILWDHGGSWAGGFGGDRSDGLKPPSAAAPMPLPALADALRRGLAGAGLAGRHGLDLLGFDACLMGSVEVAFALRDLAPVYIGSAEIDYGDGWEYEGFLGAIAASPGASAAELARAEVALWSAHHQQRVDDRFLRAQIALDTAHLEPLAAALRSLGDAFAPRADALAASLSRQVLFSVPGYGGSLGGVARRSSYKDLRQILAGASASVEALRGPLDEATAALDAAVIASSLGELRQGQGALHVGTPGTDEPASWFASYAALAGPWDEASGWSRLVAGVASRRDQTPPELKLTLEGQGRPTPEQPRALRIESPSDDIFGALVDLWAELPDGGRESLGAIGAARLAVGQPREVPWRGVSSVIEQKAQAIGSPWIVSWPAGDQAPSQALVAVPGVLDQPDDASRDARLLFVVGQPEATSLVVEQGGLARSFDARKVAALFPGASFRPERRAEPAPGQPEATSLRDPIAFVEGRGPLASTQPLAPGRYTLRVRALDVWGNEARAEVSADIE